MYEERTEANPSDLARLSELADNLAFAKKEAARIEAELEAAQRRVRDIEEGSIPELMDILGMERFRTSSGFEIEVVRQVHASIANERKPVAFRWLEEHGHGGMIKRSVVVSFDRDQEEAARRLQEELRRTYPGVKEERNVHPSTLRSWVSHRLEDGEEVPEAISVHVVKVAKIT